MNRRGMPRHYSPLPEHRPRRNAELHVIAQELQENQETRENHTPQTKHFPTISSITALPSDRTNRGRPGDVPKFCSAPNAKYTGKSFDHQSLTTHQHMYYTQSRI